MLNSVPSYFQKKGQTTLTYTYKAQGTNYVNSVY